MFLCCVPLRFIRLLDRPVARPVPSLGDSKWEIRFRHERQYLFIVLVCGNLERL